MSEAILVADVGQVPAALRLRRRLGAGTLLLTGDMATAWELERRGEPFIDEHDLVTPAELLRNWETAAALATRWWGEAPELTVAGVPLLSAAQGDLRLPIELCLDAATVYARLFREHAITRAHVFFVPPEAICRAQPAPGTRAATSLSQAVLRREAERAGVWLVATRSWRPLSREERGGRSSLPPASTAAPRLPSRGGRGGVLLLESGMRAAEASAVADALCRAHGRDVVRLSPWELLPGGPLDRPWTARAAVSDLGELHRALASRSGDLPDTPGVPLASPHLGFQLDRIFAELAAAARIGESFAGLLDELAPSLVVLGHDGFTVERLLVRIARSRGIPTAALIHGGLRPRRVYRDIIGEADRLLVWGEEDAQALGSAGLDQDRIAVVGSLAYEGSNRGPAAVRPPAALAAARAALGLPLDRPLILALTAMVTRGLAAMARPTEHRASWHELADLARRRADLTFAIKPHPSYDHFELYRRMTRGGPRNLVLLADAPLATALFAANATLLVNYGTTAALEGVLAGVPALYLQRGLYPQDEDDALATGGAVLVHSTAELEGAIDRLLGKKSARTAALAAGAQMAQRVLGPPGSPALARVVAELYSMRRERRPFDAGALAAVPEPLGAALEEIARLAASGDGRRAGLRAISLLLRAPRALRTWPAMRRHLARLVLAATPMGNAAFALVGGARVLLKRTRGARWRPLDLPSPSR